MNRESTAIDMGISITVFGIRPPVEDDFLRLYENGFRKAEIVITNGWTDVNDMKTIMDIAKWAEKHSVEINSVHGPSGYPGNNCWLADSVKENRDQAIALRKQAIEGAKILGAKYFIIEFECFTNWPHPNKSQDADPTAEKVYTLWQQSMDEIVEFSSKSGISIAVENVPGISCIKQMDIINRWSPDFVCVCLDSSHATYGMEYFYEHVEILLPRTKTTHLSDNDGLKEDQWSDRHWLPFQGNINWDRLARIMIQSGYRGCYMLEVLNDRKGITRELMESAFSFRSIIESNMALFQRGQ